VVPSRDSRTGSVTEQFRDAFEARRGMGLRGDVDAATWNALYRLGVNTTPIVSHALHVGLPVIVG
ncbi:MAG: hypothetical protein WD060_07765, partial [Pirellulales bacterium]